MSKHTKKAKTKGYYVYVWLINGVPFYVGKGTDRRAWAVHYLGESEHFSQAEIIRRSNPLSFVVEIVRDDLTNEGALLLESTFISWFERCGYQLTNIHPGMGRQERPPLTLNKVKDFFAPIPNPSGVIRSNLYN